MFILCDGDQTASEYKCHSWLGNLCYINMKLLDNPIMVPIRNKKTKKTEQKDQKETIWR